MLAFHFAQNKVESHTVAPGQKYHINALLVRYYIIDALVSTFERNCYGESKHHQNPWINQSQKQVLCYTIQSDMKYCILHQSLGYLVCIFWWWWAALASPFQWCITLNICLWRNMKMQILWPCAYHVLALGLLAVPFRIEVIQNIFTRMIFSLVPTRH